MIPLSDWSLDADRVVVLLVLAYLRIQAAILVFPAYSEAALPVRLRVGLAMALTPLGAVFVSPSGGFPDFELWSFAAVSIREMLVGLLIALPARIMASALHIATSAIGATASLSQLIGTGTEAAPHPIGNLLHLAGIALLMVMGLPLLLVDLIAQSYAAFPVGVSVSAGAQVQALVGLVAGSFVLALALAAPFILGGLLYQLLTGIVNRVMPTLPVVFIGAPAIILMALVGLALLAPAILSGWVDGVLGSGMLP